jgi:TDG/mug DNA glycosylase family protein
VAEASAGHRVTELWMGRPVETLADLVPAPLRVLCVGANPSPISVTLGHYYQGPLGKRFYARLGLAGILPDTGGRWEDDVAFEAGIGFTDVVKRPTARATGVTRDELRHGGRLLAEKLARLGPRLVIFTYKVGATQVFGPFPGHGFVDGLQLAGSEVFVMPGPMERQDRVDAALAALRRRRLELWPGGGAAVGVTPTE